MSRRIHALETASALLALGVAAPTLWMGYLRDDWLLLWSRLDPQGAPSDATGVFARPLAELWWTISVRLGGEDPFTGHALQFLLATILVFALFRLGRSVAPRPGGAALLVLIVGTHAALMELRLWAAAGNGLLALTLGVFALERWARGSALIAAALLVGAMAARLDAVLLLFFLPTLRRGRAGHGRWLLAAAALIAMLAGAITLASASASLSFSPAQAGRAVRLLLLPPGPLLPAFAAIPLGLLGLTAIALWLRRNPYRHSHWLAVAALLVAAALLPWDFGGRYLAFGVLALALTVARHPPRRLWLRGLFGVWIALQLGSAWFGNTGRELRARSQAETGLYFVTRSLATTPGSIWLVDPPLLGWTNSTADAENVVSAARRRLVSVHFASGPEEVPVGETYFRFEDGDWTR